MLMELGTWLSWGVLVELGPSQAYVGLVQVIQTWRSMVIHGITSKAALVAVQLITVMLRNTTQNYPLNSK